MAVGVADELPDAVGVVGAVREEAAHFNYEKKLLDGSLDTNWNTAIANEAFRKSLYYGLDLTNMWRRTKSRCSTRCSQNPRPPRSP